MNVIDMLPLTATYTVTQNDGKMEKFDGPLFMLWSGLNDFLNVVYPTWVQVDYICDMICKGTICNKTRKSKCVQS